MSRHWLRQPERSNRFTLKIMAWIALWFGRTAARVLLYPISAYFVLFAHNARRASRDYLRRIFGRRPTLREIFRHYHYFAATTLDRVYLLLGRIDLLDVRLHGLETLRAHITPGRGCLLLGAHLGSFELLRVLSQVHNVSVRTLMYEDNAKKIGDIFNRLNPNVAETIIHIGTPGTLLRAKESLDRGEVIGMLGDRVVHDEKTVTCNFLGTPAAFPCGPVLLAATLDVPVILFFGLYRGGRRYDVYYELLAEHVRIERRDRISGATYWMQKYAERLEHYCHLAPYNWFNYYDYWGEIRDNACKHAA